VEHAFRYGLYLVYLDLDELPMLLEGGYGLSRAAFAPASFRRADHLGDPQVPLADAVRELVHERTGWRLAGPIRLLTLLRNWGYYFNPLSLYYCFSSGTQEVEAVVAEVSNTPWRERHWYVLWQGNRSGAPSQLKFRHPKEFHVSPFLDLDFVYQWHLSAPREQLNVSLATLRGEERVFDASFSLKRRELTRGNMLRTLARFPWMTARVVQAIYWQAFRLWRKKCPFYPHPKHRQRAEAQQP
jgi:DUF1365 family protein